MPRRKESFVPRSPGWNKLPSDAGISAEDGAERARGVNACQRHLEDLARFQKVKLVSIQLRERNIVVINQRNTPLHQSGYCLD
jgi:hypothetical protein